MSPVILPVPHIQQRYRGDCLAVCAAMLLIYHGYSFDNTQLLKLLQVNEHLGTPARNILNLKKWGVTVIYKQGTLAEIHHHLQANQPCIVFVNTGELPYWDEVTSHAIVIIGIDKGFVYLNDPAFAESPLKIPIDDLSLAWLEWDEFYATLF